VDKIEKNEEGGTRSTDGEKSATYRILVGKVEEMGPLARHRRG